MSKGWGRTAGILSLLVLGLCAGMFARDAEGVPPAVLDSLYVRAQKSRDTEAVRGILEKLRAALADAPDPAGLSTRIGLLHLRLEEADSAEAAFLRALQQNSGLAAAHCGLGRVFLEFRGSAEKALPHLKASVASDSTYADGHYFLARAYLEMEKSGTKARQAADRAIRYNPNYAPAYLLLAQAYQKADNLQAAMVYYERYLEQQPEDQGAAYGFAVELLEKKRFKDVETIASRMGDKRGLPLLAQALIHRKDHEAALEAFRRYIATLEPEERDLYEDISLAGLSREVRAYRSTPPKAREAFLENFWLRKDPFKTSGGAMRRAEHYRRVWYARTFYGEKKWPWDRRGEVYIRYGEPNYRSSWRDINARVPLEIQRIQEMMAYQLYGSRAVEVTFVGPVFPIRTERQRGTQNPSSEGGGDAIGLSGWKPVTTDSDWSSVPWEVWIYTGVGDGLEIAFTDEFHSGIYKFAPIPTLDPEDFERYDAEGSALQMIQRLTEFAPAARLASVAGREPERYDLSALEPLDFYYEPLTFRGENGRTDLQVNIAIPIDNVALPGDIDTTIIVERRVALLDNRSAEVRKAKQDLAVPISDGRRGRSLLAMDRLDLTAAPGEYELAVQAWRRDTEMLQVYRQGVVLPDYSGADLMLSDLQVAQRVTEAGTMPDSTFSRGKWNILPAPSRTFYVGDPLFVYFEIYNLVRDTFGATRYEVAYEVRTTVSGEMPKTSFMARIRKGDKESVEVSYEQIGAEPWVSDYVELDVGRLRPGRYILRMNVKDLNSEQAASREGIFLIANRSR